MNYKVGDIIKLKVNLIDGTMYGGTEYNSDMDVMRGEPIKIHKIINTDYIVYDENKNKWYLTDDMIEGLWASCQQVKKSDKQELADDVEGKEQVASKLKIIDIFNMIANGELKDGAEVEFDGDIYIYDGDYRLERDSGDDLLEDIFVSNLNDPCKLTEPECVSEDGKTLEPTDNANKIEEIDIESCGVRNIYDGEGNIYNKIFSIEALRKDICDKVNELVRYIGN